jgi:hypothetical protein
MDALRALRVAHASATSRNHGALSRNRDDARSQED